MAKDGCTQGSAALRELALGEQRTDASRMRGIEPTLADATASGDLGFTAGRWAGENAGGSQAHGSYVALWKRKADCGWEVDREARIEHAVPPQDTPRLDGERVSLPERAAPLRTLIDVDALGRAMSEFASTVGEEGLAAGLRTYGRNNDFMLYLEGYAPFAGVDPANSHLVAHPLSAQPKQAATTRSADSSMAFSWGEFAVEKDHGFAYLQVWQYDAKVANWGLRLLILAASGATGAN